MMTSRPRPLLVSEREIRIIGVFVVAVVCLVGSIL